MHLDEQKMLVSNITAAKERENADLNKYLNDTIQTHNNEMVKRENDHKNIVNSYEQNKTHMIEDHNKIQGNLNQQ